MTRSKLFLVLLLVALAAVAWLSWSGDDTAPAPTAPERATSDKRMPDPLGAALEAGDADERAEEQVRTALAPDQTPPPSDGKALLRITTRTAEGRAVANVMVRVQPYTDRISQLVAHGPTNESGQIEFAGLSPGTFQVSSDRQDFVKIEVEAGVNEVDFEVKAGVAVQGRVLAPDGSPVARAGVWLQTAGLTWDRGWIVARTNAAGAFSLEEVPTGCSLGAIARGHAPSELIDLDVVDQSTPPARVELHLQSDGGELTGRVTDAGGAPIAGARVAAGEQPTRYNHSGDRIIESWTVRIAETGVDGRFTIDGLKAGDMPVSVQADGFGVWRGSADIASGQTTTLDVQLDRSALLFGTVTDADGEPEAEAHVRAFDQEPGTHFLAGGQIDFDEVFGYRETVTDEQGRYRMEGVTPGTSWVFAQRKHEGYGGTSVALARATLEIVPGSEVRWDPVIDVGRTVSGVVRFRDGHPIPHLFVTLRNERSGEEHVINSDKNGTFRFLCLEDSTYEVRVQPAFDAPRETVAPRRTGIVPDREPVEIQFDYDKPVEGLPGTISGRIADAGNRIRNPGAVTVTLQSDARWFRPGNEVVDGAFRVEDVKPCKFRLILKENDTVLACTDWSELTSGGNVDVGILTTEPSGSLRIRAARGAGTEAFEPEIYLRREDDPMSTSVELGRRDEVLVENLTPGDYELSAYEAGMVYVKEVATVARDQTADIHIELVAGARGVVEVWWPENHDASKGFDYRIDTEGVTVSEYESRLYTAPIRPYKMRYTLPAGRYHLEFSSDDGLRGELDFTIPASLQPPALRLELK